MNIDLMYAKLYNFYFYHFKFIIFGKSQYLFKFSYFQFSITYWPKFTLFPFI